MRHKLIYLSLLLAVLSGCRKDDFKVGNTTQIAFQATAADGYVQSAVQTRGTPQIGITAYESGGKITVQAFDQISADADKKDHIFTLSKSGSKWVSTPTKSYDGLTYNFYAYASDLKSIGTTLNENGLSISSTTSENADISYTVPDDVAKQPDLVMADKVLGQKSGEVSLQFHHALSCVGFVASSKHVGNTRKVRSVTVTNIYRSGKIPIAKDAAQPISWTTSGDPTGVSLEAGTNDEKLEGTYDAIKDKLTYLMEGDGYLMMVPQKLPEGAKIVMEIWDGTNTSSINTITYDIPPTTWEPGKKYIYYFEEPILEGVATYYERYVDNSYGFYYYEGTTLATQYPLKDDKAIVDAGYGLLVPASSYTQYPSVYLGLATGGDEPKDESTSNGSIVASLTVFTGTTIDCVLYPLSQNLYPYNRVGNPRKGLTPFFTATPMQIEAGVSETGTGKPINTKGYILPHYAKGVYTSSTAITTNVIRTPIQMRNISYQTGNDGGLTIGKTYTQEFATLDFTIQSGRKVYGADVVGGVAYRESIVIGGFGGTFDGNQSPSGKATVVGLIINTPVDHSHNIALFELVTTSGIVKNIETAASCVYVSAQTTGEQYIAGIIAQNNGTIENAVNRASITNNSTSNMKVAGVVGLNTFRIKRCENYGVINNQSNNLSSTTGGVVAINEKYYASWSTLTLPQQQAFQYLQYANYTESMEAEYPGAIISKCENYGRVIGAARTGGITAFNNSGGVIYTCENSAEIRNNGKLTSQIMLGGIVGLQQCGLENTPTTNPSGTTPPKFFSTIQDCLNTGNITATSGVLGNGNLAVGGIVGNNDFAKATNGITSPNDGYEIEAYGKVNQCVVSNAVISSYYSDAGGIVGLNSGSVNHSRCNGVYIRGVFGRGTILGQRNSAGGIAGTNNNYIGNCLFSHTSSTSPITSAPVWDESSSSGGIVGINNGPAVDLKSSSGYVQKCIFAAVAPVNVPTGYEAGTFAPIAGWAGGYLYRDSKGAPHLKENGVDATTGATPIYTLDDNYYASGTGVNFTNGNIVFPNEPTTDVAIPPFTTGRYPYGQTRFSDNEKDLLPLAGWYDGSWSSSRPPTLPNWSPYPYTLPFTGGTLYILGGLVKAIKTQHDSGISGSASFTASGLQIASTVRVSLNYMSQSELTNVTEINIDLTGVTFLSNNANGTGSLFFRAPPGWKFDALQTDPKPYKMTIKNKDGTTKLTYWYCIVNSSTGKLIKMIP